MRSKRALITVFLLATTLPLGACANGMSGAGLERMFAADPQLQNGGTVLPGWSNSTTATPTPTPSPTASLPANFPDSIPRYPGAILEAATSPAGNPAAGVVTRWATFDSPDQVRQFYQQQLQTPGWQVQPSAEPGVLAATREGFSVRLTLAPAASPGAANTPTEFILEYTPPGDSPIAQTTPEASPSLTSVPQPGDRNFIGPVLPPDYTATASPSPTSPSSPVTATPPSGDGQQAPAQLQQYIADLEQLGALPLTPGATKSTGGGALNLNQEITRREFARWLVATNNLIFANRPANQIRLANTSSQPAFQDVPASDPDFGVIQGLAEAGLIPSPLSGDASVINFRPDAPLARETLVLWKAPLDLRRSLPNASVESIQQTWGFQDANRINPRTLRAIQADYQNGEQSNIRRAFGFTTLFQPDKPVSRAEAAAALWFFGTQGDGLSAKDAVQATRSSG